MWQLLITMGFAGPALYVIFYLRFWWKYRRDPSPARGRRRDQHRS